MYHYRAPTIVVESIINVYYSFETGGKITEDYWGPSMKMLNDMKFLDNLKNFDKDNIPGPIMKRIREKYTIASCVPC